MRIKCRPQSPAEASTNAHFFAQFWAEISNERKNLRRMNYALQPTNFAILNARCVVSTHKRCMWFVILFSNMFQFISNRMAICKLILPLHIHIFCRSGPKMKWNKWKLHSQTILFIHSLKNNERNFFFCVGLFMHPSLPFPSSRLVALFLRAYACDDDNDGHVF